MSKFIVFMKRYRFFFALFVLNIVLLFVLPISDIRRLPSRWTICSKCFM